MPLTAKGSKILEAMKKQYGEKRGEEVFYASANAGKITGVHDALNKAIQAGAQERESQRQVKDFLEGRYVSGRDRAKVRR
jgi:hypothetical protein